MIKETITIWGLVDFLNELLEIDHDAVQALFNIRVQCNKKLADHQTVQVMSFANGQAYYIGMIGILNGLFGIDFNSWGCIAIDMDSETGKITKFNIIEERLPAGEKKLLATIEKVKEIDKLMMKESSYSVEDKKSEEKYVVIIKQADGKTLGEIGFGYAETKTLAKIYGDLFQYLHAFIKVKMATAQVMVKLYHTHKGIDPKAPAKKPSN